MSRPEAAPPEWGIAEVLGADNSHGLLASFADARKPALRVLCRYGLSLRTLFTRYALPSHRPKNRAHEAFAGTQSRFIGSAVEVRPTLCVRAPEREADKRNVWH